MMRITRLTDHRLGRLACSLAVSASLAGCLTVAGAAGATAADRAKPAAPRCAGKRIDSYVTPGVGPVAGRRMGVVELYYDGRDNCAYFQRGSFDAGARLHVSFTLTVGRRSANDTGDYKSYAGPLTLPGKGQCVTLAVRERDYSDHTLVDWRRGPVHCGR